MQNWFYVAALVLSANPSLTGQQVRDIIEQTAQKVGGYNYTTTTGRTNGTWHNEMGYGLVNALCAVNQARMHLATLSGPSTVCSSGATFTLNNLPDSASVSWDKSFNLAYVSGQGTTSYKVKSSGGILPTVAKASGEDLSAMSSMTIQSAGSIGWVRATISSSCGDIPLEKTVWAGLPGFIPVVSGYPTVTCGNSLFTEANNRTVTWSVGGPLQIVGSNYGYKCVVRGTGSRVGWVYATAANDCGSFRGELLVEISCGYSLAFSPNPSSGETTIEIATGSGEVLAPDTEWDLEVYDSMQSLKTKTQKLKGDKQTINTTGWKDGVYIVRVKIGKEIISEKLVVKH